MKKLLLPLFIGTILLSTSCVPVYRPTSINTPLFDSADEFHAGIYAGTNSVDLQTAYSLDDEFAIMINGSFANRNDNNRDSNTVSSIRQHTFGEIGVGYYKHFGKAGVFELFAGGGAGHSEASDILNGDSISAQGDFIKLFLQPTIAYKTENVQFGFVTRLSYISFSNYEDDFSLNIFSLNSMFVEPAFFLSFGTEYVRFSYQVGFSVATQPIDFNYNPFITNIGLRFTIPQLGLAKR